MKLILPLSSVIALRAAFYAVRGQFSFKSGETTITPSRFPIADGRVWLKINKNLKILDGINAEFLETIKDLQAKTGPADETPEQKNARLTIEANAILAEKENLASLTPLTSTDLGLDIAGDPMGQWANDMLDAFDQFLASSEPPPASE